MPSWKSVEYIVVKQFNSFIFLKIIKDMLVKHSDQLILGVLLRPTQVSYVYLVMYTLQRAEINIPFSRGPKPGSITVDPTTVRPDSSAARATATAKSASAKNDASGSLLSLLVLKSLSPTAALPSALNSTECPSIASAHDARTESTPIAEIRLIERTTK